MKFLLSIFIALVLGLTVNLEQGFTSSHHDSESAQENGTGHCVYKADNPFADTYQACRTNITANACMGLAEEGDGMVTILDPEYGEGDCPRETSVGSCERGGWEEVYYEGQGEPQGMQIGCMFAAGDWLEP